MIFDLLHANGQSLLGQPYVERRTRLNQLDPSGPAWQTPRSWTGGGADLPAWAAITRVAEDQNIRTVDVLIGGWSPGDGRRTGTIGFLLVGVSTADGPAYIGNVGTGFTDADAPRGGSDPNSPVKSPTPRSALKGRLRHPRWRGLR